MLAINDINPQKLGNFWGFFFMLKLVLQLL